MISFTELTKRAADTIVSYFDFNLKNRKIVDINKEGAKNHLDLYAVCSTNVPDAVRANIAKNLEIKYIAQIFKIIDNTVHNDPETVSTFFSKRLSNGNISDDIGEEIGNNIIDTINNGSIHELDAVRDKAFKESVKWYFKNKKNIFNENTLEDYKFRKLNALQPLQEVSAESLKTRRDKLGGLMVTDKLDPRLVDMDYKSKLAQMDKLDLDLQKGQNELNDKSFLGRSQAIAGANDHIQQLKPTVSMGTTYSRSLKMILPNHSTDVTLTFSVRANLMPIDSIKLTSAIGSITNRDMLFNYIKFRANQIGWKDFILNIGEIDKEVERNTSINLEDRLINSMMKRSGFMLPKMWGDLIEAKHYILIIDMADVEQLKSQYNADIKSAKWLKQIFEQLKILTLVITDASRNEMTIYDSDNPTRHLVVSYKRVNSDDDSFKMFSNLIGNKY